MFVSRKRIEQLEADIQEIRKQICKIESEQKLKIYDPMCVGDTINPFSVLYATDYSVRDIVSLILKHLGLKPQTTPGSMGLVKEPKK